MSSLGSAEQPLRVAVIGSGPAGFYVAQHLFAQKELNVEIDMFDRLPTPYGLVRFGVAPDHAKIKAVTAVYEKQARHPGYRFFGDVNFGQDITLDQLRDHYHQVVFCTGAPSDRRLGIPGEDLHGSHPATEFVAWYNGHPDYADYQYDLSAESAVVVGVGNVAVDVARILCRPVDELAQTDIADHALAALRESRIKRVYLLGRRGPAQAAFTNPEVKELGELEQTQTIALRDEVELDPLSAAAVEKDGNKATRRKLEILGALAAEDCSPSGESRQLILRFLVSPEELIDSGDGSVGAVRIVRNRLIEKRPGTLSAVATDQTETLPAELVFRSIGYRGIPLVGLPFREDWGIIPNAAGRVTLAADDPENLPGVYVSGWIKRGPSGVIGTNKPCALETVQAMLEDLAAGVHLNPTQPGAQAVSDRLRSQGLEPIGFSDWLRLDELERAAGAESGRPRVKIINRADVREALSKP
jgi:ferredoxin--NADP+ reductase